MTQVSGNSVFPLLADPSDYVACGWDLKREGQQRDYWLGLFRNHFPKLESEARREASDRGQNQNEINRQNNAARQIFFNFLDRVESEPDRHDRLDILSICQAREQALRDAGIDDPYRLAKLQENKKALSLLPRLLEELDDLDPVTRDLRVIQGVFAGNIFDMGAVQTEAMQRDGQVDFHHTRACLKPRPWLIDDTDVWLGRRAHRSAVLFVDNAGPDIILGMLPLARHLLRNGTRVLLTANSTPSLNDVTHDELVTLVKQVAMIDTTLADAQAHGTLRLVASGNGAPLIDLTQLSSQLCMAVIEAEVDLVILEGMGRAIETNLQSRFTCDVLKLAMIKDHGVAEALGGSLFDLALRYEPLA